MIKIEEDIKRCGELIKPEHSNWIGITNQTAIKKLIKGYRELEKHNINLSEQLQMAKGGMIIANLDVVEDFIPKSKIKEKIEKLEKEGYWEYLEQRDLDETIKLLQELLEEE